MWASELTDPTVDLLISRGLGGGFIAFRILGDLVAEQTYKPVLHPCSQWDASSMG